MRAKKNNKFFLFFLTSFALVALSRVPNTSAFWPPLQDVQVTLEEQSSGDRIRYEVYDPVRGLSYYDYSPWNSNIAGYGHHDGVVAWEGQTSGANPDWRVGAAVYDPVRGSWINYTSAWFDNIPGYGNKDGVVAWTEQSGSTYRANFILYDPMRQQWKLGSSSWSSVLHTVEIINGTVHYGSSTWDYNPSIGQWSSGTTQPLAYFFASPTSGPRPLAVWFIDMSIGASSWSWNFGDGAIALTRSLYHTFDACGMFTVTQTVSQNGQSDSRNATIKTDTIGPAGSIQVNGGNPYTSSNSAILTLSASDNCGPEAVSAMRLKNEGESWSEWQNYSTTQAWSLTPGDGVKTVLAQFKDRAENLSNEAADTICLDTTPPMGSITINGGASYTNSNSATLTLMADDGCGEVASMRLKNEGESWSEWQNYVTSFNWSLTPEDGVKTVSAEFRDALDHVSDTVTDSITIDSIPPTAGTLSSTASHNQVSLAWTGFSDADTGISHYTLYSGTTEPPDTEIYSGSDICFIHTDLTNGTEYQYRIRAVDLAGNPSEWAADAATPRTKLIGLSPPCSDGSCATKLLFIDPETATIAPIAGCPNAGLPNYNYDNVVQGVSAYLAEKHWYCFVVKGFDRSTLFCINTQTGELIARESFPFHLLSLEWDHGNPKRLFAIAVTSAGPALAKIPTLTFIPTIEATFPNIDPSRIITGVSAFDHVKSRYFFAVKGGRGISLYGVNTGGLSGSVDLTLIYELPVLSLSSMEFDPDNRNLFLVGHGATLVRGAGPFPTVLPRIDSVGNLHWLATTSSFSEGLQGISAFDRENHRYFLVLKNPRRWPAPFGGLALVIVDTENRQVLNILNLSLNTKSNISSFEYEDSFD